MTSDSKNLFDRAVEAVSKDTPTDDQIAAARARVWQTLASTGDAAPAAEAETLRGCADVRAQFPGYRAGTLSEARKLLVRDHLNECSTCRNSYRGVATQRPWREEGPARRAASRLPRYAMAAALVAVVGLGWLVRGAFMGTPSGARATVDAADGPLYLLTAQGQRRLERGGELREREWLRTPRGSHAVIVLRDGSRLEIKEHTELGVSMNRHDLTVHLERGHVIVRAAKRRDGHLMVATEDATAIVTGTVFAVNRGTKGTRISVLEGSVQVESRGSTRVLTAGGQFMTRGLQALAIREEIAWSPEIARQTGMLQELSTLAGQLETVRVPGLRYGSTLLGAVPEGTLVFASLPNYGSALDEAFRLFSERLRQSPALDQWWQQSGGGKLALGLPELVATSKVLSEYLGDEIVLALSPASDGQLQPLLLSRVRRPGLREALPAELQRLGVRAPVRILDASALATAPAGRDPLVLVTDSLVAVALDAGQLRAIPAAAGPFAATAFGRRLADCYRDGVGLLFAADLENIAAKTMAPAHAQRVLHEMGADGVRYFIAKQERRADVTQNRATLSFAGPRTGVASWLAAPAPMGSLDFISSGASFAAAFVAKEPAAILDDLLRIVEAANKELRPQLQAFESRTGVELRRDLAAPLGNDVAFAIDGPLLPVPSWKIVLEVQDPLRLTSTIETLVAEINRQSPSHPLRLERRQSRGQTIFTLTMSGAPMAAHWLFSDGYLVMAPSDDLLHRAIRVRSGGGYLRGSDRFRRLVPLDRQPNFSAVVYHNLGEAGAAVADWLSAGNALAAGERDTLQRFAANARPGLVYVYGEESEIQVASAGGFFGLTLDHFVGSAGLADLLHRRPR